MPKSETLIVITDGVMERWNIDKVTLDFNKAVVDQLTAKNTMKVAGLLSGKALTGGPSRPIGACLSMGTGGTQVWSIELDEIGIECPWTISPDGKTAHPQFSGGRNCVDMRVVWKVPRNMRLVLMVAIESSRFSLVGQYFAAFDNAGRSFRIPLSNIYEDCKLCYGRYPAEGGAPTSLDAIEAAYQQFLKGRWNSDLIQYSRDLTSAMFTFTIEKDKFIQRWRDGDDWTQYSQKVGNSFITSSVVLNPPKE